MVFYSNAKTCGITTLGPRYDAYYALSTDHGQTFVVQNLRTCTQRPALDFLAPGMGDDYTPREYIGIALDDSSSESTFVTVSYSGTAWGPNTSIHASAIYAQVITVTNP